MALIDYEHANRETDPTLSNWFDFYQTTSVGSDGTGPFSYGRYLVPNDTAPTGRAMTSQASYFWMQGHIYQPTPAGGNQSFWCVRDSGSTQIMLRLDSTGRLQFYRGGSLIQTTALPVVALNAWYFIQWRVRIHGSSGVSDVYINGASVMTFAGNTSATGNNSANEWGLFASNGTRHANIMLYDETGNAPNARTPETRIFADLPTGNGVVNQFTPLSGQPYTNVDEQPNDGDTSYVYAAAAPASDTYAFPGSTVPAGSVVYAVGVEYDARKDDGGTNDIAALMYASGGIHQGADTRTLTATYQRWKQFWDQNPQTGVSWTVANSNSTEVGFKRVA